MFALARTAAALAGTFDLVRQDEVDLAVVDADRRHLDPQGVAETIHPAGTLACKAMADRIEMEIVIVQRGNVYQPGHIDTVEFDEDPETVDPGDDPVEGLADLVEHVLALQGVGGVTCRIVGAPLGRGTVLAHRRQVLMGVVEGRRCLTTQQVLECTMDHQIGIATDRRGEMCIRREREPEVTDIVVRIHRLHHRTQQHDLDDVKVRARLDPIEEIRIVLGRRAVATFQPQSKLTQKL